MFQLFGGFLIGLSSLPEWIQWMKYISLFRYAIEVSWHQIPDVTATLMMT